MADKPTQDLPFKSQCQHLIYHFTVRTEKKSRHDQWSLPYFVFWSKWIKTSTKTEEYFSRQVPLNSAGKPPNLGDLPFLCKFMSNQTEHGRCNGGGGHAITKFCSKIISLCAEITFNLCCNFSCSIISCSGIMNLRAIWRHNPIILEHKSIMQEHKIAMS